MRLSTLMDISGCSDCTTIQMQHAPTDFKRTRSSLRSVSPVVYVHRRIWRACPGFTLVLSSWDLRSVVEVSELAVMHSYLRSGLDRRAGPDLLCALHRSTVVGTERARDKRKCLMMHAVSEVLRPCINLGSQPDLWESPMLAQNQPYGYW